MNANPDDTHAVYERQATEYDKRRSKALFEARWLARFAAIVQASNVDQVRIGATAALRAAENAAEIIEDIEALFGTGVEVITGPREAELAGKGVALSIPKAKGIVADLGGGSLELIRLNKDAGLETGISVPCGTIAMQAAIADSN